MEKQMKILVTGAKGFVGKNLIWELKNNGFTEIFEYDIDSDPYLLDSFTKDCEFVFNLAGVNRPKDNDEFYTGNQFFVEKLINSLIKNNNRSPILFTSSIHAEQDNDYGKSKKAGEELLIRYSKQYGVKVLIYRLPNLFGKWSRPNYNSVVATFCYNIANGLPINIHKAETEIPLVYIDDLLEEFIRALKGKETKKGDYCHVPLYYQVSLGKIAELLQSFKNSRQSMEIADMADDFTKKLYSTYTSYLPKNELNYKLKTISDERGCFAEFIKSKMGGQVSINVIKPGVTKGNHWHHTKVEKFIVVSGEGVIRFRNIMNNETSEYFVSDTDFEVVDIPTGLTHSITNTGARDLIIIIWANEPFNPTKADTYRLEV